jgi:hypothetical protein
VHHNDYGVFKSPVSAFERLVGQSAVTTQLQTPDHGETVPLRGPTTQSDT